MFCAVAVWLALAAAAAREKDDLSRMCLLLIVATSALLSFGAAELTMAVTWPACFLPLPFLSRALRALGRERPVAVAALVVLCLFDNIFFLAPLKAAQVVAAPAEPAMSCPG